MTALLARARGVSIPQLLLICSAVVYGATFAALVEYGRPGLGISTWFFLAVILAAAGSSPAMGACAGLVALFLYELAIHRSSGLVWSDFTTAPALTRLTSYVAAGLLTGFLAARGRRMLANSLYVLEDLIDLAHSRAALDGDDADEQVATPSA